MTPRLLAIMGSAETTPTMTKPHRRIFERIGTGTAVLLDTPYGFQENADDISARAVEYFAKSVSRTVGVASYRSRDIDALAAETARTRIRSADWVFAGPGSPSYALRTWAGSGIPGLLADKLEHGGAVVFSSAAALTIGVATVPVYEIYKAGSEPAWLPGLDLLSATGLNAAVIPHYDNAEGGHHDTRYCYLGERRLAMIEPLLPAGAFVLGIDEHTGILFDLDARTVEVYGLGGLTVRRCGASVTFAAGTTLAIDELAALDPAGATSRSRSQTAGTDLVEDRAVAGSSRSTPDDPSSRDPLSDGAARLDAAFGAALEAREVPGAVAAILELDALILEWSADNAATDAPDRARGVLRSMIVRLGEVAVDGARQPRDVLAPVVEVAIAARRDARERKDWSASDSIRDGLAAAGVEVRDTPDGMVWDLR